MKEAISKPGKVFFTGGKEIRETKFKIYLSGEYRSFYSLLLSLFVGHQQCFSHIFTIGANAAASREASQCRRLGRLFVSSGGNSRLFDLIIQHRSCRLLLILLCLCRSIALSSFCSLKRDLIKKKTPADLAWSEPWTVNHTVNSSITWQWESFRSLVMWLTSLSTVCSVLSVC